MRGYDQGLLGRTPFAGLVPQNANSLSFTTFAAEDRRSNSPRRSQSSKRTEATPEAQFCRLAGKPVPTKNSVLVDGGLHHRYERIAA